MSGSPAPDGARQPESAPGAGDGGRPPESNGAAGSDPPPRDPDATPGASATPNADTATSRASRDSAAWSLVRAGGRPAFHGLMCLLTALVWVGGEVAGNVLFRGGTIRLADLWDDLIVSVLLGNFLAWLFWSVGRRHETPRG